MSDIHGSCNNKCPDEWERKTVDELSIRVGSGVTPRGGSEVYKDEGVIFVRSQNVKFEGLDLSDVAYIDDKTNDEMKGSEISPFDVLLNITGASIGRCCFVPDGLGQANVNQHVCAIRLPHPTPDDAKFLSIVLSSSIGQSQILRLNAGGNREGLNYQQLRSFEVPWPTSYERTKIAKILTTVDNLIEKTEALIAKYQAIKQGMMHDLFTRGVDEHGHLRPPYDEAPELYKEFELGWIPKEWEIARLGELAQVGGGVTLGRKLEGKLVAMPYLRVANVQDGFLDLSEIKMVEVLKGEVSRYLLESGDVVMTEGGDFDKLGRGTVWRGEIDPCLHQNHIFRVRPNHSLLRSDFLAILTLSSHGKKYFLVSSKQTTNLATINSTQLKAFPVLLPKPKEQDRFVDSFRSLNTKIDREKAYQEKLSKMKTGLMQDLLTGKVRVKIDESEEVLETHA